MACILLQATSLWFMLQLLGDSEYFHTWKIILACRLPQSANKNRPAGISSQNKADTSRPSVLWQKTLPLPDEGSKHTRTSTQNAVQPGQVCGWAPGLSKTNTVHMGKWDFRRNRNTFYSREEEIWNNNNIVLYCGQAKPTYIQRSLTNSGTQSNIPCSFTNKTRLWPR